MLQWLCIAGLLGLACRWQRPLGAVTRSLCDAAYWMYLIHIPVVVLLQGALLTTTWSIYLKFAIVTLVTTAACHATWLLVRPSPLGKLLGRPEMRRKHAA